MGLFDRPYVAPIDPGTYAEYMARVPDAWAGNGTDYVSRINQYYGENPGSLENYLIGKEENGPDPFTAIQNATNEYNARLGSYLQGQELIDKQYNFAPDQKLTTEQLSDLGINLNPFQAWDKQVGASAESPVGRDFIFAKNPDGTYTPANTGLKGGPYRFIQMNDPTNQGSWTDYMDAAITLATIAGTAYVAPQAIGAAFAPAASVGGEALGATGGINFAATGGANGLLNSGAGGAFSPSGIMATQSAAGLGGAGTGIIQGLVPSSVGLAGTAGAGSLAGIAGTQALAGLGGAYLGTGLTPEQLAQYESGQLSNPSSSLSAAEALKYANQARQALGVGSTLAKLVGGGGGATGGGTGGTSQQQIAQYLRGLQAPAQAGAVPSQIKMNQNPFTFDIPGQTRATEGMYDVSGVNPMANALRKA